MIFWNWHNSGNSPTASLSWGGRGGRGGVGTLCQTWWPGGSIGIDYPWNVHTSNGFLQFPVLVLQKFCRAENAFGTFSRSFQLWLGSLSSEGALSFESDTCSGAWSESNFSGRVFRVAPLEVS